MRVCETVLVAPKQANISHAKKIKIRSCRLTKPSSHETPRSRFLAGIWLIRLKFLSDPPLSAGFSAGETLGIEDLTAACRFEILYYFLQKVSSNMSAEVATPQVTAQPQGMRKNGMYIALKWLCKFLMCTRKAMASAKDCVPSYVWIDFI